MATISILSGPDGPLTRVGIFLPRRKLPQRVLYGLPPFMEGVVNDVPKWQSGRLQASQTPKEQLDAILFRWVSGKPLQYDRMFKDLTPARDEVWEMKTPDLRIFGWIYRPRIFIAAFLDYADWYKKPTARKSYEEARKRVMEMRESLDLDQPKFTAGTYDALV